MVPLLQAACALNVKDSLGYSAVAHCATAETLSRLLSAGADERGRKGLPMPEPRSRVRDVPPAGLVEEMRRHGGSGGGAGAGNPDGGEIGGGGRGGAAGRGRGRGGKGGGGADGVEANGKGGGATKAKPSSPWSLGVDEAQQKKDAMSVKDFLKVRPRKEEGAAKAPIARVALTLRKKDI